MIMLSWLAVKKRLSRNALSRCPGALENLTGISE